jgi:peptidoglycan hydrolase-like protein with peptidoglycan-binding domain
MNNRQKQWQLFFLDYYGEDLTDIDGIIGPKSETATLQFQKEFFPDLIAHDSIFGDSTAAKSMEIIDRIQEILQSIAPDLKDDGLAGPKTLEAMKLYQEAHLLPATGRVDDATWELLRIE